jgi:hypothetical protein
VQRGVGCMEEKFREEWYNLIFFRGLKIIKWEKGCEFFPNIKIALAIQM